MAQTQLAVLFTSTALIIIGLYSAIFIDNIIKKIIGISFIEEGANLFIVAQIWRYCAYFNAWNGYFLV